MSAEELKQHVRTYADEHLPGWACSGVSFRIGDLGAHVEESLLVLPLTAPATLKDAPAAGLQPLPVQQTGGA